MITSVCERDWTSATLLPWIFTWLETGATHPHWASLWSRVLSLPHDQLCAAPSDDGETMTAARQSTPFAGCLSPRDRWSLWRSTAAP